MAKRSSSSVSARRAEHRARQKRRRILYYALAIGGGIIIVGLFVLVRQQSEVSVEDVILPETLEAPPNADGRAWGPADAPVLVQEFSDFQ